MTAPSRMCVGELFFVQDQHVMELPVVQSDYKKPSKFIEVPVAIFAPGE